MIKSIITIVVVIITCVIVHHLFPLIKVIGVSMFPTYLDGEIILGTRLYRKSKLKQGDVIVYKCPTDEKTVIKRIKNILSYNNNLSFYCLGDNSEKSYDSRVYGYVSSKNLVCKVINQRKKFE